MPTTVRRKTVFNAAQTFVEHLTLKHEGGLINKRSEALKKRLKEWLPEAPEKYENENGSIFVDLDETVEVGGQPYKGMELRRAVSTKFNEETAEAILTKKGVLEEALTTPEPFIDQDKVYRLVQEGKITEKDVDKMFEESESYSFWPVKGEVL